MTPEPVSEIQALLVEIRKTNELLSKIVRTQRDWRLALRQGLVTGLGGLVGATVLVSILLTVLKPLENLSGLKPTLEELSRELQRRDK